MNANAISLRTSFDCTGSSQKTVARRLLGAASVALAAIAFGPQARAGVELVSVSSAGVRANLDSQSLGRPSADGRFVVFDSKASNLVPGDTNGTQDVFVRDRLRGTTRRVSLGRGGVQGSGASGFGVISADGNVVAFESEADNLVPGDTNRKTDIFVRYLRTGVTKRVSVSSAGRQANGRSATPAISGNGRYVAFHSRADNLVPGGTIATFTILLHDLKTSTTRRVSLAQAEGTNADLSWDGRFVAFTSPTTDLVPGDTGFDFDVFVWDRADGTTRRASVAQDGGEGNGNSGRQSITPDGRFVLFQSDADNLVPRDTNAGFDVFVRDLRAGTTNRVSLATPFAQLPLGTEGTNGSIAADGKTVVFETAAAIGPGDTNGNNDAVLRDRRTATSRVVSVAPNGTSANRESGAPKISADGRTVVFTSAASDLVPGDTNGVFDVFVATP